jgi:integrase
VEFRALVATAAGAGLRWGECAGLAWGAVDLDHGSLKVVQVAVETAGAVAVRRYPKTRAGVRSVPLPAFLTAELRAHRGRLRSDPDPASLVFGGRTGAPPRRANFRKRVWLPSLVRAGLLGRVDQIGEHKFYAVWPDRAGLEWKAEFTTEREAVEHVALKAAGGLRFHDLRHSYATWLVSDGVPVNLVQKVMGHEQASTTLNRYTHAPDDYAARVLAAFDAPAASPLPIDLEAGERSEIDDPQSPS